MRKLSICLLILLPLLLFSLSACGKKTAGPEARCAFGVMNTDDRGNAWSEAPHGYYPAGAVLTAHAVPTEDSAFLCWTVGASLTDGGAVLSYEKDYSFTLEADTWLYPNFREHDSALVLYHANGGTVTAEGAVGDALWDTFSLAYYLYPNTLPEQGYFAREGYTLIGYNTRPDESGEFYNLGGKAFEDTDAVIELWCVWRAQSPAGDFTFVHNDEGGGWIVTGYRGPGGEVVLPDTFEGEPVVGLAAGALAGNDTVTGLVLPASLRVAADGSCSDMPALASLVLFDSLTYVSDASFSGDAALSQIYISAATNPHYSDWFNNHSKKIEILRYWRDDERPLLVILGGSSVSYAVDATQLQGLLNRDYVVLNCGTNGANLFNMSVDWALRFMEEGDFLLHIAEYSFWQLGGIQCAWETFRSYEGCYNVFSWVDISGYEKFFDSFGEFLTARQALPEESYEDYVSSKAGTVGYYDNQGTLTVVTAPNGSEDFWQGRKIRFADNWLYSFMITEMNTRLARVYDAGVDCALGFTPLNRNSLYDDQTDEGIEDFERYLATNLNVTIISDLQENILDPAVFYDDDYHLAAPARMEYTARLAEDLNAFFAARDAQAGETD